MSRPRPPAIPNRPQAASPLYRGVCVCVCACVCVRERVCSTMCALRFPPSIHASRRGGCHAHTRTHKHDTQKAAGAHTHTDTHPHIQPHQRKEGEREIRREAKNNEHTPVCALFRGDGFQILERAHGLHRLFRDRPGSQRVGYFLRVLETGGENTHTHTHTWRERKSKQQTAYILSLIHI